MSVGTRTITYGPIAVFLQRGGALRGWEWPAAVSTINAGISGGLSGYVGSGKLQGAELGAGEALAFAGVHFVKADLGIAGDTLQGDAESAGLHGLVGGFFSVASRGKFSSGFLAAGTGDLARNGDLSPEKRDELGEARSRWWLRFSFGWREICKWGNYRSLRVLVQ